MKASYTKLKSGAWGVRVLGTVQQGQSVTVTKKDGGTKEETVKTVIWSGQKEGQTITLCAIARRQAPRRSGCECDEDCCAGGCHCDSSCNCRGGNIYDC